MAIALLQRTGQPAWWVLGLYAWSVAAEVPIAPLMAVLGVSVSASMALLAWRFRRLLGQRPQRHVDVPAQVAEGRSHSGL